MVPKYMRTLRKNINNSCSIEDLKGLAFDLVIDWDHLHRETKPEIIRSMILYQVQRGQLDDLITLLREERPKIVWEDPPQKEQQLKDAQLYMAQIRNTAEKVPHYIGDRVVIAKISF